jgi:hypothetical protein
VGNGRQKVLCVVGGPENNLKNYAVAEKQSFKKSYQRHFFQGRWNHGEVAAPLFHIKTRLRSIMSKNNLNSTMFAAILK